MLMTLDDWLARFFGAGRRAGRAAPLAQRAAYGHDGLELRQTDSYYDPLEMDEEPAPAPYAPYLRRPRGVLPDPMDFIAASSPPPDEPPRFFSPPPPPPPAGPAAGREQARLEAAATQRSREILRDTTALRAIQPAPAFHEENIADALENTPSPDFWRVDQPNVRFTRTPESSHHPPPGRRGGAPPRRGGGAR